MGTMQDLDHNYGCTICPFVFKSEEKRIGHMTGKHNHPCDTCNQVYNSNSLLKDHREIDHGLTRYACPYDKNCQTTYADRRGFKRHEGYHSGLYQCPLEGCGKTLKTEWSFMEHQYGHEGKFACEVGGCGRTFQTRTGLVRHGFVHDRSKGFQCGIRLCRRIFPSQTRLDQHLKSHQTLLGPVSDAETEAEEGATRLASGFISKFFEGIESLTSMPKGLAHLPVQHRNLDYCIEQLVQKAVEIKAHARSSSWYCLFLAGTIWSSRHSLPAQTTEPTSGEGMHVIRDVSSRAKRTASRWGGAAEVVNAVVKSLYPNWNSKAYLVFHALAAKKYALSEIGHLSSGKRSKVVGKIVAGLRNRQSDNFVVKWTPFDPAHHLSQMFELDYEDICLALNLPSLGQFPVAAGTLTAEQNMLISI